MSPDILAVAARRKGQPYALPPDGVTTTDCSLYVLTTLRDAGVTLPTGVRTAEQIRQAAVPVDWQDVRPGDLLFFEQTYDAPGPAGPDGRIASHVGISLGLGTRQMWDANDARGNVGITDISTGYWQFRLFDVRRAPALVDRDPGPPPAPGRRLQLTDSGVRLREAPTTTSGILDTLMAGTIVTATDDYDWREVRTSRGDRGWIAARYLEPVEDPYEGGLMKVRPGV